MNRFTNHLSHILILASCAAPTLAGATATAPQLEGNYRMEYQDIFYGPASYEVSVKKVAETDSTTEISLLGFPFPECRPVQLFVSADGATVTMPNNQHSLTDEYNDKQYLQYVDPKVVDENEFYLVTEKEMTLSRDPRSGRISWFGGDFVEGIGWGYFVVVGAPLQGYLAFINQIDMIPLNANFNGTYTRDNSTRPFNHGCNVELGEGTLKIYGLMQMNFTTPVEFKINPETRTLTADSEELTEDPEAGIIYLANPDGGFTVTATATVTDGKTLVEFSPFTASSADVTTNAGVVSGSMLIPFDIFASGEPEAALPTTNLVEESESWYTLTGIAIERPTLPGLYIQRRGTESKIINLR